jgi:hypothetical protein
MCSKCSCTGFYSATLPLYDAGDPNMAPGWIIRPSRKCMCKHSEKLHTDQIYVPRIYGFIATFARNNKTEFVWNFGLESQAAAEEGLRNGGFGDAVIRIAGSRTYLALAEADNGWLGWDSGETRAAAERLAKKHCRGRHPVVRLSFHTGRGEVVNNFR